LPPRPQRLPPLRAFHLSASRNQLARAEPLKSKIESGKRKIKELALQRSTCVGPAKSRGGRAVNGNLLSGSYKTACR